MKALIFEGIVRELHGSGFPVHESLVWVDAPDGVAVGWHYENGEFSPPEVPQPTQEEIVKSLTDAVQAHLDAKAQERGYDDIKSAVGYVGDKNPKFDAEGQAAKNWRSDVWTACYAHMDLVLAGQAPIPTKAELLAMLPSMEWPV